MRYNKPRKKFRETREQKEEDHDAFIDTLKQIRLMSRDIFQYNPTPIREQPDILRKIRVLNYALAEFNDEFERRDYRLS